MLTKTKKIHTQNAYHNITQLRMFWTSLVAQWIRIHLPMQRTWVRSPVREDPTCVEQLSPRATTTEPALYSPHVTTTEPVSQLLSPHATTTEAHTPRASAQQQEKPLQ